MVTDAIHYRGPTVLRYFAAVCRNILDGDNAYEPDADAFERESKIDRSWLLRNLSSEMVITGFLLLLRQLLSQ